MCRNGYRIAGLGEFNGLLYSLERFLTESDKFGEINLAERFIFFPSVPSSSWLLVFRTTSGYDSVNRINSSMPA